MKIGLLEVKTSSEVEPEVFKVRALEVGAFEVNALEDDPLEVGDLQDIIATCSSFCFVTFFFLSFFFFSFFSFIQQQNRKVLNIL